MPDWNGIVPTTFSVASSMIQNCFGNDADDQRAVAGDEPAASSADWHAALPPRDRGHEHDDRDEQRDARRSMSALVTRIAIHGGLVTGR